MKKRSAVLALALFACVLCAACAAGGKAPQATAAPQTTAPAGGFVLPDDIRVDASGVPQLRVYVTADKEISEMDLETYLQGVVAGEMKNDWPMEALRAQAILARTFVVRFITEKQSRYDGADISTDISEAQAYDAAGVNGRVREAVNSTRGLILSDGSEPIYAWFHAHSGGRTATAAEGLSYQKEAPYTQSVESEESGRAPEEDARWSAQFAPEEVLKAAEAAGVHVGDKLESAAAGEAGESGRLKTLIINGKAVPANEFRVHIGSGKMRSTLIDSVAFSDGVLALSGKGYGHGVGMSQWGAYSLAEKGEKAEEIINKYFKNVDIVQMWN